MIRLALWLVLFAAFSIGSAREEPSQADPVRIERLLVRLEGDRVETSAPKSGETRDKLSRAERLVTHLEKMHADKIDPELAAALIAS